MVIKPNKFEIKVEYQNCRNKIKYGVELNHLMGILNRHSKERKTLKIEEMDNQQYQII